MVKRMGDTTLVELIKSNMIEEANEAQENLLTADIENIRKWSNIPTRYKDAQFVAKTELQEKLILSFRNNFNGKKNLIGVRDMLVYGSIGTGKTYITVAAMNRIINANIYCRYITEHELLELYFQKRYDDFNAYKKVPVLVIDELGKRELTDWQMIQLEELISYRYNYLLPTIYITNMKEDEFKSFVGDRIASRLRENKVIRVMMSGDDLRGKIN